MAAERTWLAWWRAGKFLEQTPEPGDLASEWVSVGGMWPVVITAVVVVPLLVLAWWQLRRR